MPISKLSLVGIIHYFGLFFNFSVEYKKGQDPSLLMTGVYSGHHNNMFIGISPDAYVVAITMGRSIGVFNTTTGELEELLENVHSGELLSKSLGR